MEQVTIQAFAYHEAVPAVRREIAQLLEVVWPNPDAPACAQNELPVSHRAELAAQSFCCRAGNRLVGYAAVLRTEIIHCGHTFKIAGLSCVATHPGARGCGVGSKVVSAATQYMAAQTEIDVGIFTCHPDLAAFYQRAGAWEISPGTVLLGNRTAGALTSEALPVVVLLHLFSDGARANRDLFDKEPVSLGFPNGEFL